MPGTKSFDGHVRGPVPCHAGAHVLRGAKTHQKSAESAMGRMVNSGKVWTPPENHIV